MLTKCMLVNMSKGSKRAWRKARSRWKDKLAFHDKINNDVNAVVANQDTRMYVPIKRKSKQKGKCDAKAVKFTKKNFSVGMKTRKEIEKELLILRVKIYQFGGSYADGTKEGRIIALGWVLELPSIEASYREIKSMLAEKQLYKDVRVEMKTRKDIEK